MEYFYLLLSMALLVTGTFCYGIWFILGYFNLNPLNRLQNRLCWMESICVPMLCIGSVATFSLPNFEVASEIDLSDNSLTNSNSLENSSIDLSTFEFSLNLTSLTLGIQVLLVFLVVYLFQNLKSALVELYNKYKPSLAQQNGQRQARTRTQVQPRHPGEAV